MATQTQEHFGNNAPIRHLISVGFTKPAESWPFCYFHKEWDMYLVLYVDDFLMSGPEENMEEAWTNIGNVFKIDDPGLIGLYLGCVHGEGEIETEEV